MSDAYERAQLERRQGPPVTHDLKTWPVFYGAVMSGAKTFEVRKMDRDFKVGDFLCLREWDPERTAYTGASLVRAVVYVLKGGQFGIEPGYCIMGIE